MTHLGSTALPASAAAPDLDRLERNIRSWQDAVEPHGVRLRPHVKTHKVPAIAALQSSHGAHGIAVAKVAEAEVFCAHGFADVVVAFPVVGEAKWQRLAALAEQARITVNVESEHAAQGLSAAAAARGVELAVQIEIDSGFGRCGIPAADVTAIESLARLVHSLPGLALDGVTTHRGIFFERASSLTIEEAGREEGEIIVGVAEELRRRGLPVPEVTAGGTITGRAVAQVPGITEVRAGTYVFHDLMQVGFGSATEAELALTALCTVVSSRRVGGATIDGGSKTFSGDGGLVGAPTAAGRALARAAERNVVVDRLTEEHGMVTVHDGLGLDVGERIAFYPMHACTCVNLSDELFGIRDGHVEHVWPVLARGKRT